MDKYYLREVKSLFNSAGYQASDAEDLFMDLLRISYSNLHTGDWQLEVKQMSKLKEMINRRMKGEPVAHIVGYKEFLDWKFKVTDDTLIPRPETEVLVNEIVNKIIKGGGKRILEIGTGTGCVIISIVKELLSKGISVSGVAIDISEAALNIAKFNAGELEVSGMIDFIKCDVRDFNRYDFDVVVSNPPYIPSQEVISLESCVKDYEPHIALDGGADGLHFYREIARYIAKLDKCILGVEFGIGQANKILKIFDGLSEKKVIKDLRNVERVIICEKI